MRLLEGQMLALERPERRRPVALHHVDDRILGGGHLELLEELGVVEARRLLARLLRADDLEEGLDRVRQQRRPRFDDELVVKQPVLPLLVLVLPRPCGSLST